MLPPILKLTVVALYLDHIVNEASAIHADSVWELTPASHLDCDHVPVVPPTMFL